MKALAGVRHIVLDLDGTVYKGATLFPWTLDCLERLRRAGIGHTFLTNNTSHSKSDYVRRMRGMGIPAGTEEIYTAADATIDHLRLHLPDATRIALLGTPSLREQFEREGFSIDFESPQAVVVGFDTTLDYARLCRAAWWISRGLPYIATHPDLVCPTDEPTVLVDCGAICAALNAATGRTPVVLGKPDPGILAGIARKHGIAMKEIAMVGDRLYTDVVLAHRAGAVSVLVLSGEATREEAAAFQPRPDLILANIGELGVAFGEAPGGNASQVLKR